ncbi:MAG: cytochrome P450 [Rhodothermales bacterium]|nr:cytochrome P450 [Rhodothermales bacterium]
MRTFKNLKFGALVPGLLHDPLPRLSQLTDGSDEITLFAVGAWCTYLLNRPADVRQVLHEDSAMYDRARLIVGLEPLIGGGLFTSDEETWVKQRQLLNPAFRPSGDHELAKVTREELDRALADLKSSAAAGPVDLEHPLKCLCFRILSRVMFSPDLHPDHETLIRSLDLILQSASMRSQLIRFAKAPWKPLVDPDAPISPDVHDALTVVNAYIHQLLDGVADGTLSPGHILALLGKALESGEMDRSEARDHIATFLFAGFDTVAEMLTWAMHLLGTHPEVQEELHGQVADTDELDCPWAVLPDGRGDLLQHVLFEALRLYPPAWAFFRRPKDHQQVGEERVKKGTGVMVCPYTLHRNSKHWENPDSFEPERYVDKPEPAAYIPFGFGKHTCVGRRMAIVEGRVLLAGLVRAFRIGVAHDPEPKIRPGIIIQSAKPLRFVLEPR